jgi:hypothetical protein
MATNAQRQAAYRRRARQAQEALLSTKGLPPLPTVSNVAGWSRWSKAMRQITELLEQVKSEMEAYYDERSERWLESEAAEEFQDRLGELHEFIDQAPDRT